MKTIRITFLLLLLSFTLSAQNVVSDNFTDLDNWVIEIEQGGKVTAQNQSLELDSPRGATIWYKHVMQAPCKISYEVTMIDKGGKNDRVSDLNCFVMATDPSCREFFVSPPVRTGNFPEYHKMPMYYVGYAANNNSTTRLRRYDTSGKRTLLPEHDLKGHMSGNVKMKIEIVVSDGRFIYKVDGKEIFNYKDPDPLTKGYFAFRTLTSHQKIQNFKYIRLL